MAAPSYQAASTGSTDAGGAWSATVSGLWGAGAFMIAQILQDGTTNGAVTFTGSSFVNDLAGSAGWTQITGPNADGSFPVGSPASGRQFLFLGRKTGTSGDFATISGDNSTSEDLYWRGYWFADVSDGTTLATVIENGSAGNANNGVGTSTTCSDTAVTTLGVDRLALNFPALSDDAMGLAVFTGASGGTWGNFQIFESATGTDGTIAMEAAAMASAGTIDGGSATITSIGWGVVGFALIGTTPGVPPVLVPTRKNFIYLNRNNRGF